MATKKLTVEVDADVTKAKRKLVEMESSGGGGMSAPVDTSADRAAKSLDNLGRKVDDFGRTTESAGINMKHAVKAFAGMGIGMAMSYAAKNMEQGSTEQRALTYGGSAAQGAAMGMMFGPWGAALGGALGLGKAYLEEDAQKKAEAKAARESAAARQESLASQTESIKRTREWKATIDALNNTETSLTERQKELQAEIAKREERERELKRGLAGEAGIGGDDKNFNKLSAERARNASEIDALKALAKQLEKEGKKERGGSAADYSAFDSLARIGGNFAGSEQGFRDLQRTNEAQLETLKSIERKTGKGGTF